MSRKQSHLALAVLESSGLKGWLFTRGKCYRNTKQYQINLTRKRRRLSAWHCVTALLTLEYLTLPSRWLTVRCSLSSSSTQGAVSAVGERVLSPTGEP